MSLRDLLLGAVLFGSLPLILVRPYVGVLVWSWISYMNPHKLSWTFQNFPLAATVAATLFLGLVFSREPKRIPWFGITVVWILWVAWMNLTTVFALAPDVAYEQWNKVMKIQLISFVTLMVMRSEQRIRYLVFVIVGSIGFYGIKGGIFTIATGGNYKVWGPVGTFIEGNNEIALAIIMIIPLLFYLWETIANAWIKRAVVGAMVLCGFAVLGSYSRGAFLAGAAMIFFLLLKTQRRFLYMGAALLLLPVLLTFMPEQWHDRMASIAEYRSDASAMGRINAWYFAYNVAVDRPLVGGGFDAFQKHLFHYYAPDPEDFHDAHSIYFEVLGEHGFIGLMLFVALGVFAFRTGTRIIRETRNVADLRWAGRLAAMLQVSFVGYAAGGAFLGLAYFDLYYHLVALIMLTRVVVAERLAQAVPTTTIQDASAGGFTPASTDSASSTYGRVRSP